MNVYDDALSLLETSNAVVVLHDPYREHNPNMDTMVILTNGPVDKPLKVYDGYDARSEIENSLSYLYELLILCGKTVLKPRGVPDTISFSNFSPVTLPLIMLI